MNRFRSSLTLLVALVCAMAIATPALALAPGESAYMHMEQISAMSRMAGSAAEYASAGMIEDAFEDAGYSADMQLFTYTSGGKTGYSQNVVASLPGTGAEPRPLVIVGAHYDSVTAGNGADDNASGTGCILEIAEDIASYERDYDVVFVAFGAEEVGLKGSAYYVSQMSAADKARTVAMVNFDSLAAGDINYIHAGFNELTGPRDAMLGIIGDLGLPIETQPGLNPHYPAGLTPDGFSDYTAFNIARHPDRRVRVDQLGDRRPRRLRCRPRSSARSGTRARTSSTRSSSAIPAVRSRIWPHTRHCWRTWLEDPTP